MIRLLKVAFILLLISCSHKPTIVSNTIVNNPLSDVADRKSYKKISYDDAVHMLSITANSQIALQFSDRYNTGDVVYSYQTYQCCFYSEYGLLIFRNSELIFRVIIAQFDEGTPTFHQLLSPVSLEEVSEYLSSNSGVKELSLFKSKYMPGDQLWKYCLEQVYFDASYIPEKGILIIHGNEIIHKIVTQYPQSNKSLSRTNC